MDNNRLYAEASYVSEVRGHDPGFSPSQSCGSVDIVVSTLPTKDYCVFDTRPGITLPHACANRDTHQCPYTSFPAPSYEDIESRFTFVAIVKLLISHWNRLMLIIVPFGLAAPYMGADDSSIFILNCLAIIPLADLLCEATNNVAAYMGETMGALVNVTMGNLTELVIFIQALVQRQYVIVRTSLLGSMIVNMLLVLGLAILAGETRERCQVYNILATRVAAGLLCLATISLLIPSIMKLISDDTTAARKTVDSGRATSVVLIIVYFLYLWTQMSSERLAYKPLIQLHDLGTSDWVNSVELGRANTHQRIRSYPRSPLPSPPLLGMSDSKSYDSFQNGTLEVSRCSPAVTMLNKLYAAMKAMSAWTWLRRTTSVVALILSTVLISVCSENLVSRVDHFVAHSPLSHTVVGLIILPIVGNVAELVSGIFFASRKQIDLAFAISIGSAVQIALFVTPLIVLIAWGMDRDLSLQFTAFESVALASSELLFLMLVLDSRCSVPKGACLCAGYAVLA